MSFSFSVKAASKADAKIRVAAEMDKVVSGQPIHANDYDQQIANANQMIDLLPDDDSKDVSVSCNGSLGWTGNVGVAAITSASSSASAYLVNR